jgi:hypothetical protein
LLQIGSLQPHLDLLASTPASPTLENASATIAETGSKTAVPKAGSGDLTEPALGTAALRR